MYRRSVYMEVREVVDGGWAMELPVLEKTRPERHWNSQRNSEENVFQLKIQNDRGLGSIQWYHCMRYIVFSSLFLSFFN